MTDVFEKTEQAGLDIVHSLNFRPSLICHTAASIREKSLSFHNYYTTTDALATSALVDLEEHPRRDQLADVLGVASLLSDTPIPLDLLISIENAIGARLSTDVTSAWWVSKSSVSPFGIPPSFLAKLPQICPTKTKLSPAHKAPQARRPRLTETLKQLNLLTQLSSPPHHFVLPPTIRAHFLQTPRPRHAWLALSALASAIQRQTLFDSPTLSEIHASSRLLLPHARALYPLALQLFPTTSTTPPSSPSPFKPEKRDPQRIDWHLIGHLAASQGDASLAINWHEFTLRRNTAIRSSSSSSLDPVQDLETILSLSQLCKQSGDIPRYNELIRSIHLTNDILATNPDLFFRTRLARATHLAENNLLGHAALELDDLSRIYPADDAPSSASKLTRSRHILALHSLSVILKLAGRTDEASAIYARLHPLYAAHLPSPSHPTVLDTLEEHAHALQEGSALHILDAQNILQRTLRVKTTSLGPSHPSVLLAQTHLAGLYESILDYASSEDLYERALPRMEDVLGEHHVAYLAAKENLALSYWSRAQGDEKKGGEKEEGEMKEWAVGLLRDVLRGREEIGMVGEAEGTRERLGDMLGGGE